MSKTRALDSGWSFTQLTDAPGYKRTTKKGEWISTQEFPTTIHVELLKLKKIPDPVRRACEFFVRQDTHMQCIHSLSA
jgi:beta-mannosidase